MTCMDCKHFHRSNGIAGNNYIGLCLKTDKPVLKVGFASDGISCEHYKKRKDISGIIEDILQKEFYDMRGEE